MFSRRGSGRDHGGGGAERDTAVSLSSAAHRRTVHTGNAHARVRVSVCVCVSICVVTLWFVFFPLQVVLSTCLCFCFCLLPVSGWFGDARGGGRRQPRFLLRIASRPSHFQFLFLFSPLSVTGRSMLTALSWVFFFFFLLFPANNSPSSSPRFLQICSRPLPPQSKSSVISPPQAFPGLAHRGRRLRRKQCHDHNEHVEFS